MSKLTTNVNSVLLLSAAAALAACGGGSGGGSDSAATADPVAISSANAPQVAGAAYNASGSLEGAGLGGAGFLTGAVTATTAGGVDMVEVIIAQLKASQSWFESHAAAFLTGAVVTATENCTDGGSVTLTLNDADGNQDLSTGDSLSASFSSCSEAGTVMNGSISINNVVISGDPLSPPYSLQLTVQANNFSVTENSEMASLNGAMTLSQSTGDGVSFTNTISGTSMALNETGGSATLSAFQLSSTENGSAYTLDMNATVSSSEIGGAVTIVTDTTFQGVDPNDPFTGQATITGANNSSVTLIAVDSVNVTLEVDADGDGVPEDIIATTWDAL
jgi:hypothetical protein